MPTRETTNLKVILYLVRAFTRLPTAVLHSIASFLGLVAYWLYRKERNLALGNVRTFYPNASADSQQNIVIRSFQHTIQCAFDLMRFAAEESTHWPAITIDHEERIDAALRKGRGVIVMTGHYGNPGILAFALKGISSSPGFLWHKPTRRVGWVVAQFRRYRHAILTPRTGFEPLESSVRGAMKAGHLLKRGDLVIMAADLTWGSGFIPVSFLKRLFPMSRVPAAISLRTHALLVPVITVRHLDGHYNIVVEEPIEHQTTVSLSTAERGMTETFARILARHVESAPEQWCWTHKVGSDLVSDNAADDLHNNVCVFFGGE
jgi:Kdo2-lipid IVA lauroyltransferase/acyltransferase